MYCLCFVVSTCHWLISGIERCECLYDVCVFVCVRAWFTEFEISARVLPNIALILS